MENRTALKLQSFLLDIASFAFEFVFSAVALILVYHTRDRFGMSPSQIGLVSSFLTLSVLVGSLTLQRFVNYLKPNFATMTGALLCLIGIVCFASTSSVPVLLFGILIYGFGIGIVWPQLMSWLSSGREGEALSRAQSFFNFSWSSAAGLGPFVIGFIIRTGILFSFALSCGILVALLLLFTLMSIFLPTVRNAESAKAESLKKEDHSTPLRFICWAGMFLIYTCFGVVTVIFPLYLQDVLNIDSSGAGTILAIRGLITCIFFIIVGRISVWKFNRAFIIGSQFAFALLMLSGALFCRSLYSFVPFFIFYGIIFSFIYEESLFHGVSGAVNRPMRIAIHESMVNGGQIIGASIGGVIYQSIGFSNVMYALAALSFFIVAAESLLRKRF